MTIYLDFDNTIVESNKRIIDIINKKYNLSKTEQDLKDFDFNSIHPITLQEKTEMFESDEFYDGLEFKPYVLDVLNKYKDSYELIIVSKGTPLNLKKKEKWLIEHIPFNYKFIGIDGHAHNKSSIDMTGGIQIDDSYSCLKTNADIKILYKSFNNYPWQISDEQESYMYVNSWEDIDSILDFYNHYNYKTLEKI